MDHASDCTVCCDSVIYSNVHDVTPAWHRSSLMIILSQPVLKRNDYLDGPELCTVCAQLHILHVWVQHQFQMTRETQTQSHVVHTCSISMQTYPPEITKGRSVGIYSPPLLSQVVSQKYCAQ